MSVLLVGEGPRVAAWAVKWSIWRRLARAVDACCARRSKQMVPGRALRRSRRDMNRCRRFVHKLVAVHIEDDACSSRAAQDWNRS